MAKLFCLSGILNLVSKFRGVMSTVCIG